ncbi:phosphopantetheine-binding protein [Oceanobacillus profundus]|uniref:Alanine-phosphoribitol ligase n=1 Tax=Oceanobacillus profundus TaxID=372463 RepID=A0A417YHW4_9BACI|nr:phosphopantetheine-binding protein [Oceanobacillus profundus]RHW32550.1 alanine-phosphoribitol ligase [Oceanobacillus profundus]
MNKEEFIEVAKEIVESDKLELESSFKELGMDSTHVIELLIEYEVEYNIDILDDNLNLDDIKTLGDAYDYISKLVSTK